MGELSPIGNFIIELQESFSCCGYFNACDYCDVPGSESQQLIKLPNFTINKLVSCHRTPGRCTPICPQNKPESYEIGCKEAIDNTFSKHRMIFDGLFIFSLVVLFLASMFSFILCIFTKSEKDRRQEESERRFNSNKHHRYQTGQSQYY